MTEKLKVLPPEVEYIAVHHVLKIPASDPHFSDRWELRKFAEKLVEQQLGDEVQLTSLKVKKPHLLAKTRAKIRRQEPQARLIITTKF